MHIWFKKRPGHLSCARVAWVLRGRVDSDLQISGRLSRSTLEGDGCQYSWSRILSGLSLIWSCSHLMRCSCRRGSSDWCCPGFWRSSWKLLRGVSRPFMGSMTNNPSFPQTRKPRAWHRFDSDGVPIEARPFTLTGPDERRTANLEPHGGAQDSIYRRHS